MTEHTLHSIAFPVLDSDQIAQLANCATVEPKHYRDGETLIAVGDRSFKFFLVNSGEIEILDYSGDVPRTIAIHRKGQFTGDISHLTGTPAVITAIARGNCQVFEVSGEALRHVLNQCPGLSDIILQASESATSNYFDASGHTKTRQYRRTRRAGYESYRRK